MQKTSVFSLTIQYIRLIRGTQQQVTVDICSVEVSSPQVFDVEQRVHLKDSQWGNNSFWRFRKGHISGFWQSKTSANIFGKQIVP